MVRRILLASVLGVWFGGAAGAEDRSPAPVPSRAPTTFATAPAPKAQPAPSAPTPAEKSAPADVAPDPAPGHSVSPAAACAGPCDRVARVACRPACGPEECGWLSADYLLWSVQSGGVPPLVVRDAPGTPLTAVGLPTAPGQTVLFGNSGTNGDLRGGFRINGGLWLGCDRLWAVSGEFLHLGPAHDGGTFASNGNPPLARPFFNVALGQFDAELVAFPGILSGSVNVDARNTFTGYGAFVQRNICCCFDTCNPCAPQGYRIDFLAGYRRFEMNDTLQIREDLLTRAQGGQIPPGTRIVVTDQFRTENTFDGALLALTGDVRRGSWSADFRAGASLGNLNRTAIINGSTVVAVPGQPLSPRVGGLLAQPSNIGQFSSDAFTAVPEIGFNLGYQLTRALRVHIGYTFIYLPNTWRAGDQIDLGVDATQLTGASGAARRPAPRLVSTGTAVQGMNFGVLLRY